MRRLCPYSCKPTSGTTRESRRFRSACRGSRMRCCAESVGRRYVEMERPVAARQFRREAAVFLREDAAVRVAAPCTGPRPSQPLRTVTAKPIEPSPAQRRIPARLSYRTRRRLPPQTVRRCGVLFVSYFSYRSFSTVVFAGRDMPGSGRRSRPGACLRPGGGVNPARPIRASAWGGRFGTAFGRGYSSEVWSVGIQSSTVTVNQI